MQWFEKKYKERFSSDATKNDLSSFEGVDSSQLWAQIEQSIPQEKNEGKISVWWTSIGLLLLCFTIGLFFLNDKELGNHQIKETIQLTYENKIKESEEIISKLESTSAKVSISKEQKVVQVNEKLKTSEEDDQSHNTTKNAASTTEIISSSTNGADHLENNKIELSKQNRNQKPQHIEDDHSIQLPNINTAIVDASHNKVKHTVQVATQQQKRNESLNETNSSLDKKKKASVPNREIATASTRSNIDIQSINADWLTQIENSKFKTLTAPSLTKPNIIHRDSPWSIKLYSNLNLFDISYQDDTNTEKFAGEANQSLSFLQDGSGAGANIGYQLTNNLSISVGVESNQYRSQLNKIITSDIFQLDTNQVVRNAISIRTVKRTNRLSTITIPLSLSYDYSMNENWGIGTELGLSYSIVKSQNGKLFTRENSIIEFDSDLDKQFNNYLSIVAKPYIRYSLNKKIDLSVDFGLSVQNHGRSNSLDLKQHSVISTIGLGLKYNL